MYLFVGLMVSDSGFCFMGIDVLMVVGMLVVRFSVKVEMVLLFELIV